MIFGVLRCFVGKSPAPGWPSAPQLLPHCVLHRQVLNNRARGCVNAICVLETFSRNVLQNVFQKRSGKSAAEV
eukprot:362393-Chlamydomonas_euryale.AAC.6